MAVPDVVADTNVVSFLVKRGPDADRYVQHVNGRLVAISFMTVAELEWWAIKNHWGERRRENLELDLRKYVVHPYSRALATKWAEVRADAAQKGRTISHGDAWIAATALLHDLPLVTDNRKDFAYLDGLTVISEPRRIAGPMLASAPEAIADLERAPGDS